MIVSSPRLSVGGHRMRPRVFRLTRVTILLMFAFLIPPNVSVGQKVYWSGYSVSLEDGAIKYRGYIQRANLDGTEVEPLPIEGLQKPMRVALDTARGRLYWAEERPPSIWTANLDGSEARVLFQLQGLPASSLAVDEATGDAFWLATGGIWRGAYEGDGPHLVVARTMRPTGALTTDPMTARMYWDDGMLDPLRRAGLDGSGEEAVPIVTLHLNDVDLDSANRVLYWGDGQGVWRGSVDDWTASAVLPDVIDGATRIALAPLSQHIIWVRGGVVRACRLSGDDCGVINDPPFGVTDVAVDDRVALDCDSSRTVDAADVGDFAGCLVGPDSPIDLDCLCADENGDRRVDLRDAGALQRRFSGAE